MTHVQKKQLQREIKTTLPDQHMARCMYYMLPPTCKKGNCSTKPRLHCPISTRQNTCVIKRKGNQYNKKVNHINLCIQLLWFLIERGRKEFKKRVVFVVKCNNLLSLTLENLISLKRGWDWSFIILKLNFKILNTNTQRNKHKHKKNTH